MFVERLWGIVTYEDVDLRGYEAPTELRTGLVRYYGVYNTTRRHSALDRRTLDVVYFEHVHHELAARKPRKISLTRLSYSRGPFLSSICWQTTT